MDTRPAGSLSNSDKGLASVSPWRVRPRRGGRREPVDVLPTGSGEEGGGTEKSNTRVSSKSIGRLLCPCVSPPVATLTLLPRMNLIVTVEMNITRAKRARTFAIMRKHSSLRRISSQWRGSSVFHRRHPCRFDARPRDQRSIESGNPCPGRATFSRVIALEGNIFAGFRISDLSPGKPPRSRIAHWGREPPERGCVEDQPQQSRSGNMLRLVDDDTAALRFMERKHLQNNDVSWGHEPLERGCVEDQPQQS